uniref:Uncharacterized protein n=1 Tax=Parascaris equorum TaxID=6256 RepID=A0A914RIQ7_PAREQ
MPTSRNTSLEPGEFLRRRTSSTSAVLGRARTTSTASAVSTATGSSSSPLHIKKLVFPLSSFV